MTSIEYMIEFAAAVLGFFAAIVGLLIWLTHVEQTLPYVRPDAGSTDGLETVEALRAAVTSRQDPEISRPE